LSPEERGGAEKTREHMRLAMTVNAVFSKVALFFVHPTGVNIEGKSDFT